VPAANKCGKDFVAGFLAVYFFLTRSPCRIITTSAKDDHLRVLWGEIDRFLNTSKYPLKLQKGMQTGLICNQREIRRVVHGEIEAISYVRGMVASQDAIAAMQGHHVASDDGTPKAAFFADECSSVADSYYRMADTWAHRMFLFGNTWPCENFFKQAVRGNPRTNDPGGDKAAITGKGCDRKIIRIKAEDSPNVKLALAELAVGKQVSHRILIPGVKTYEEYARHRRDLDQQRQCVILDADWWE